jgi:hypothetical protein
MAAILTAILGLALSAPAMPIEVAPLQRVPRSSRLDVDVWINKDEGGVYRPGESMRIYFRTAPSAYVLVFNVDTDGYVHVIYPYGRNDSELVEGGRTYGIPSRSDPYDLVADGPQGVEYVVAVASPVPFRDVPWYLSRDRGTYGADEEDDPDAGRISGDPYVGIDRIVRRLAPPGSENDIAVSDTYFYIERRVEYPRYVCADCHGYSHFYDPYSRSCAVVEIRVDATWTRYAPIRFGAARPRYFYRIRTGAPTRYRAWRGQWSSLDGAATLRARFLPGSVGSVKRDPGTIQRTVPPEFKEFRRSRPGRFWRGQDEILKLRERRIEERRRERDAREREDSAPPRDEAQPKAREEKRERPQAPPPEGTVRGKERPQGRAEDSKRDREDSSKDQTKRKEEDRRERPGRR